MVTWTISMELALQLAALVFVFLCSEYIHCSHSALVTLRVLYVLVYHY